MTKKHTTPLTVTAADSGAIGISPQILCKDDHRCLLKSGYESKKRPSLVSQRGTGKLCFHPLSIACFVSPWIQSDFFCCCCKNQILLAKCEQCSWSDGHSHSLYRLLTSGSQFQNHCIHFRRTLFVDQKP